MMKLFRGWMGVWAHLGGALQYLIVGTLAVVLALAASTLINQQSAAHALRARNHVTQEVIEKMNTIRVGDTLPKRDFMTLSGTDCQMPSIVEEKSSLLFVDLGCELCMVEMEKIAELPADAQIGRFVFVSHNDPVLLGRFCDSINLKSTILLDYNGEYARQLGVFTYPFAVQIERGGQITQIIAGSLTESELEAAI